MKQSQVARRRLDDRLDARAITMLARPHRGWVRAIRDSLGMTAAELGRRMGTTQQAVVALEKGELRGSVRLETLERAADAMNCELVYAMVPRTSLDKIVNARAREKARQLLSTVDHHSRLEDQAVSPQEIEEQIDELATGLIDKRGLWQEMAT